RLDVIYVCSNADIARQNTRRLQIGRDGGIISATRITMLPLQLRNLRSRKLNFISFTPGTAFDLSSNTGIRHERAILYWILKEAWDFASPVRAQNVLRCYAQPATFENAVNSIDPNSLDRGLVEGFLQRIRANH